MAEVVGDAIVGALIEHFISLLDAEFRLLWGVEEDVDKLLSKLSTIEAVLEDAETSQFKNKSITDWLRKLKNVTYDAADVLAKWVSENQDMDGMNMNMNMNEVSNTNSVSTTCFSLNQSMFRRKVAKSLKKIIAKFDELAAEKSQFDLKTITSPPEFDSTRETTSGITEPHVYGRDMDKEKIICMLLNNAGSTREEDIVVYPIVGMGGMGKTTLAQLVYNDKRIENWFHVRIWVCVSEPFDVKRILNAIIGTLKERCDVEDLEPIKNMVQDMLRDKRYLLVLDDVWNESQEKWNKLMSYLSGGAQGSSIIVTTRVGLVASITSVVEPYALGVLSKDDSWALFKYYAFGGRGDEEEHLNLAPIGMEIVKKCQGLPLALKSLASLLRWKTSEKHWEVIRDSEIWKLEESSDNYILPALRVSYNHLPSRLKQCFAYCSVFPKDYEMGKDMLIRVWIANGFIQPKEGMELEEIGNDVFDELLQRSFFQDIKEDGYGNIKTCKLHDLIHDLACSISINECFIAKFGKSAKDIHVPKTIRHLTVIRDSPQSSTLCDPVLTSKPPFRTLLFIDSINIHSFKFSHTLRVLDLRWMGIKNLPSSVCHLKLLRYLDLSHNDMVSLPKSISMLRNLQTLDLKDNEVVETLPSSIVRLEHLRYLCLTSIRVRSLPNTIPRLRNLRWLDLSDNWGITELPPSIWNLENLRYLDLSRCYALISLPENVSDQTKLHSLILLDCWSLQTLSGTMRNMTSLKHLETKGCRRLTEMPAEIGQFTCLQTLSHFKVGDGSGGAGIDELQWLNQLRRSLEIERLENVKNADDAKTANLRSKRNLTDLSLSWSFDDTLNVNNSKEVLEGLQLPPNLQELKIKGYGWEENFPEGLFHGNLLNSLQSLEIEKCKNLKSLPAQVGDLAALTWLKIDGCRELVSFPQELQKLTSLTKLAIWNCKNMKCLPVMETTKNSLVYLEIQYCENLASLSSGLQYLTSLEELLINGCQELDLATEDYQHLISLRSLKLCGLSKLTDLPKWIQHLPMLNYIWIWECKSLRTMPEWLKHLTTLQILSIGDCHPDLKAQCERDKGEDWHKVSHIPNFSIWSDDY